jgi:hypothetical protein
MGEATRRAGISPLLEGLTLPFRAWWDALIGEIGDLDERTPKRFLDLSQLSVELANAFRQSLHVGDLRARVLPPSLSRPDLFGGRVSLGLEGLDLGDETPALLVVPERILHESRDLGVTPSTEAGQGGLWIGAEGSEVEHFSLC